MFNILAKRDPRPRPLPAYRARGLQLGALLLAATLIGCASTPPETPRELAATQPSNATVTSADFEKLWRAADLASRDLLFMPARQDRRAGLYETAPVTSGQWFEPWRRDAITPAARTQSSLATIRRTIRVKVDKAADGSFVAKPTVLVERYALAERRITTSAGYRTVFRERNTNFGTIETDAGLELPASYWYAVGNDPVLEEYVARAMNQQLKKP
jgi:hypothetical protein